MLSISIAIILISVLVLALILAESLFPIWADARLAARDR